MTGYSSYLCFDYEAITTSKLKSLIVQQIKSFSHPGSSKSL